MLLQPDWSEGYANAKAFTKDLGQEFKGPGWYLTPTDTMLLRVTDEYIYVNVWNNPNARKEIFETLALPIVFGAEGFDRGIEFEKLIEASGNLVKQVNSLKEFEVDILPKLQEAVKNIEKVLRGIGRQF